MGKQSMDAARGGPLRRGWRRLMDVRLGGALRFAVLAAGLVLVLLVLGFAVFVLAPVNSIPALEPVDELVYLEQGWGSAHDSPDRQRYYYTPQGTSLPQGALTTPLRYDWFVHLEMPFSRERFAAPAHMQRYRFLVDPVATPANPDRLPVGFTRHFNEVIGEDVLDITCAACHTGELHVQKDGRRIAVRIDGGQAMHAFTDMQRGAFGPTLVASLIATWSNPVKFSRFARRVIGARYPEGRWALHGALRRTIVALATQGQNDPLRHLYPVREGFGRTDALGRIANTVFGDHLAAANYQQAVAPVSYPYLWNIWKFDWVQYTASVRQPLARNIGEALGVGAVLRLTDAHGNPLPPEQRVRSSVRIPDLVRIEHTLQTLAPPRWPEDLLGAVDRERAHAGAVLFEQHCRGCHGPHVADAAAQRAATPDKPADLQWTIEVVPLAHIGTDPAAATGFVQREYDLGATGLSRADLVALLQPLQWRDLARQVRFRLEETIAARSAQGSDSGNLPALLAQYPDPDASAEAVLPRVAFAAIAAELRRLGIDVPAAAPAPAWQCGGDCQAAWLGWNVTGAEAAIGHQLAALDPSRLTEGEGLNVIGLLIKNRYYAERGIDYATQRCIEGFGALDLPQQIAGYKPRPLAGVWATPPFLHNGSVPSLYEMLLPPEQRSRRFLVGRRDYDTRRLGYIAEAVDGDDSGFWLDTTIEGNHNSGHAFAASPQQWQRHRQDARAHPLPPGVIGPELSDDERYSLLEYLKVHEDPATPADYVAPTCALPGSAL